MGVLIGAFEKGLITLEETEKVMDMLRRSNVRLSEKLLQMVLKKESALKELCKIINL